MTIINKNIKIAIHHTSGTFSDRWLEYCNNKEIDYKLVDCFASDIIEQMKNCSVLMWHWSHQDYKAVIFSRQLTSSLEMMGKHVFPNSQTCWHFDDKVGQKYLLEAIGAPLVPSYIFYDRNKALDWAKAASYPKVFKLRGGAGSANVKLVRDAAGAKQLINRAFSKGFKSASRLYYFQERLWHFKRDNSLKALLNIFKGIGRLFIPTAGELNLPVQKNYVYFQNFIPDNNHDIRVVVIGKRLFAIKRIARNGDFRASGSGHIIYDPDQIPKACLKLAFLLSKKMQFQCMAYDFVFDKGAPLLVEVSYGFKSAGYVPCPGFWNDKLEWTEGNFTPEIFMLEDLLRRL